MALVCDVQLCFVTFSCGILGQVRYLIVSIPDHCHLSYYEGMNKAVFCRCFSFLISLLMPDAYRGIAHVS